MVVRSLAVIRVTCLTQEAYDGSSAEARKG